MRHFLASGEEMFLPFGDVRYRVACFLSEDGRGEGGGSALVQVLRLTDYFPLSFLFDYRLDPLPIRASLT